MEAVNRQVAIPDIEDMAAVRDAAVNNVGEIAERRARNQVKRRSLAQGDPKQWKRDFDALVASGLDDITLVYGRVSDVGQTDGWSPDFQIRQALAWISSQTMMGTGRVSDRGVADIYMFDVISGQAESRIAWDTLMEMCKSGKVRAVVTYRFDRFSRDPYNYEIAKRVFKQHDVGLYSATEDIPTGALGKFMESLLVALGQFEAAIIAARMSSGRREAIRRQGVFHGAEAPYGYRLVGNRFDSGNGRMYICESEAKIVRIIFALAEKGYAQSAIANWLDRNGIPTRRGCRWTQKHVSDIWRKERGYRAEGLFSKKVFEFDQIAHEPILPTRPEGDREYISKRKGMPPLWRYTIPGDPNDPPIPIEGLLDVFDKMTEEQARVLKLADRLRQSGSKWADVAARLNEIGSTTPTGVAWTQTNVRYYLVQKRELTMQIIERLGVESIFVPIVTPQREVECRITAEATGVARIHALRAEHPAWSWR